MNGTDGSLSFISPGPQSPCERTDLRMAIVADHLGLSWTGEAHSALLMYLTCFLSQSQTLEFTAIFRLTVYLPKNYNVTCSPGKEELK